MIVALCVDTGGRLEVMFRSHRILLLTGLKISKLASETLSSPLSLSHKYPAPELDLVLTSLNLREMVFLGLFNTRLLVSR